MRFGAKTAPTREILPSRRRFSSRPGQPFSHTEARGQFGKGPGRAEKSRWKSFSRWKSSVSSIIQKPVRAARVVKKIPDGLSAGISPTLAKVSVL